MEGRVEEDETTRGEAVDSAGGMRDAGCDVVGAFKCCLGLCAICVWVDETRSLPSSHHLPSTDHSQRPKVAKQQTGGSLAAGQVGR